MVFFINVSFKLSLLGELWGVIGDSVSGIADLE